MKLADISIRHPVFIYMSVFALLVLGFLSYFRLPVELFPDISLPTISVTTPYPGASPKDVETQVSKPIEDAVSVLKGVKKVRSISTEGISVVIIEFELERDVQEASQDVREKVSVIRKILPKDIGEPTYEKFDPSDQPILTYSILPKVSSADVNQVRNIVKNEILPKLERIEGVASIRLIGGNDREIEIAVDRNLIEYYRISFQEIIQTLRLENIDLPSGTLRTEQDEILLKTSATLRSPIDFNKLIVRIQDGVPIYLEDVAQVHDTYKESTQLSRTNGIPSITLDIRKQSGTNTIEVSDRVKQELTKINSQYPFLDIRLAIDESQFIRNSRDDVLIALIEGILLTTLIVLLFFRDFRSTIITVIGLPVCLVGTLFFLNLLNYSINLLTLLAMSLSIGLLVDDAIVVRENIFRWLEKGIPPFQAARQATSEVALAVLATTLTIIAVFLPIAFTTGIAGKFFRQFGLTITIAVFISLVEAFTLAPMLSAYFFKQKKIRTDTTGQINIFERFYDGLNHTYQQILIWSLNHKALVLLIATVVMFSSIAVVVVVGIGGEPRGDRGQYSVVIEAPQGISLQEMSRRVAMVEQAIRKHPKTKDYFTTIGTMDGSANQASILVNVGELNITKKIMSELRPKLQEIPGIRISLEEATGIRSKTATIAQRPIQLNVQGSDISVLQRITRDIESKIKNIPGLVDLDNSFRSGQLELHYRIDRNQLARYNLSSFSIATLFRQMVYGETATKYLDGDDEVEVNVRLKKQDRVNPVELLNYQLPLPNQQVVPLSEIVTLVSETGPSQINRQDRTRQVVIAANIQKRSLSDVYNDIRTTLKDYQLPTGYTIQYEGQFEQTRETFSSLFLALFLAILFVYMILAAQFNSFLHPFTIMLALPLAVIGGFYGLLFANRTFDMMAFIGLIMLMGLVTKNSILLVDFANQQKRKGLSTQDALLEAGKIRLRPILMTTFAMIFGMLPTAMGWGSAAAYRISLGVIVIGGLISSTFLSLVIVPVAYQIFDTIKSKLGFREQFYDEKQFSETESY
ncbi:MAG: efflux RND transporter permease subunit [bacterium]|nr:efflux RND transporter permease subunit [bacterium]